MPRVPRPDEMPRAALSPANQPAQLNVGVASRIGQAGRDMGNAISAIGGAFGEVAGKISAANDANAEADARLAWLKGDAGIQDDIRANVGEDGNLWQSAPERYGGLNQEIDNKYRISDPARRANFERWREMQTFNRGQGAVRSYQDAQRGQFIRGFDGDVAGLEERIGRGEVDPATFGEHYQALTGKLQGMNRMVLNEQDVQAKSNELRARLVGAVDRHLAEKNPEERASFWNQVRGGRYEIDQPGSASGQAVAPSTGGGPDYRGRGGPAAIRYNNPGAMWPGPSSRKFGAVDSVTLNDGQGNKIAVFPDAVSGAAAQFDLLERKYTGKTLASAIHMWSGGNSSSAYAAKVAAETGLTPSSVLTREMIRDPRIAIPIARSMSSMEAGRKEYPLEAGQWAQAHQMAFGGGTRVAGATATAPAQGANDNPPAPATSQEQPAPAPVRLSAGLAPEDIAASGNDPAGQYDPAAPPQPAYVAEGGVDDNDPAGTATAATAAQGQPRQPGPAGIIPMGRLAPGQEFTVKTPRGEIKIPAEWINAIPPKAREAMAKRAGDDYRMFERGRTSIANGMTEDGEAHMALHGRPHDSYDAATIQAAYARNPEALRKHVRRMAVAQAVHAETANIADLPSDEIINRVAELEQKYLAEGAADAGTKKVMDLAGKRIEGLLKQRERDPGGAVETSREVMSVREKLMGGAVRNKLEALALMDARMQAQQRLDIPEHQRSPISMREAQALAPALRGLNPGDAEKSIRDLHTKVAGMYGEKYSGIIVRKVIETSLRDKRKSEQLGAILTSLDEDESVSPTTLERMRSLDEIGRREAAIAPATAKSPPRGMMGRLYDMLPSRQGIGNFIGGAGLGVEDGSEAAPQPTFPVPSPAHIDLLKKNPGAIEDFEKKFGPGAADRAVPGLRRMIMMNQAK